MLDINKCIIKESGIVISFYGCSEFHNKMKSAVYNNYSGIITFYSYETINQPEKINKSNNIGLLSSNYISSLSNTPSCIISIFDISEQIFSNESLDNISISLLNDICSLKQVFLLSPIILIILNTTNNSSVSSSVKNLMISYGHDNNIKYLLDKNIFLLYSKEKLLKEEFLNGLGQSIITNAGVYYNLKKKKIKRKITEGQSIIKQEKLAKYYIKLGLISLSVHKEKKNYSYFQKAYNILSSFIERSTYIFSDSNDIRIVYMNLRNACDFLFVNIMKDKNINTETAIGRTINHISIFSYENFFFDNKDKIDLLIKLWDIQWKYEIYDYVSSKFNVYYFDVQKINTMQRKIDLCERNKDEIDNLLNYKIDGTIFKVDNDYIEKFPKYYQNDNKIIKDINYILKLAFIEENKEQFNKVQNKNIFKKIINDFAFINVLTNNQDIQNQQKISFYAINIAKENKIIFTCEERIVMLSMILSKSYKFYDILIKFTKLFLNLFDEYVKLLHELNLCDYTLINESNKNFFIVYIKNIFVIFSLRELTTDEKNAINSLFLAKITNPYQFILQPNSFIKIKSIFKCDTQVYLFTLVDYSVTISSKLDLNLEVDEISLKFTNENRNLTHKCSNIILSHSSSPIDITQQFFINTNDIQCLYLTTVIIKLKNSIELIIPSNEINKTIQSNSFICIKEKNKSENPVSISFPKEVQIPVNNWKLFSFPIISNSSILIKNVNANISLESPYDKKPDNEFATIFFGEIAQLAKDTLIIQTDLISDKIQFLLNIYEIGNFRVQYKIEIHIAHKDLPNDIQKIKFFGQIDINVIMPFSINNTLISPLYMLVEPHYVINSINTIIKSNVTLNNLTNEDIYINDIICIPNQPWITIETFLTELLKLGKKNIILANSSFSIPFNITFTQGNNGSPGSFELQWQSDSLRNYANDKLFNTLKVNFDVINANNLNIDIYTEQEELNEQIKYRLMIKNTSEKQIYTTNIEIENKSDYYFIDGNVSINSQIFEPQTLKTYTLNLISKTEKKNLTKLPLVKVHMNSFSQRQDTNYLIVYNPSYCLI